MTSYKFKINESGIVQRVQESGAVHARLTMREMTRLERKRANERITHARQYLPTMTQKRQAIGVGKRTQIASAYQIHETRLHGTIQNPAKLKIAIQALHTATVKHANFWDKYRVTPIAPTAYPIAPKPVHSITRYHNGKVIA